mmetsp:Transcript_80966/g.262268  ORF Transcript_80966/g.262268 Transcript_80966/m.262268 type:complete len:209 (-) Transcript_80966:958-1584(-)
MRWLSSSPSRLSCNNTCTCACPRGSWFSSIVARCGRYISAATRATSAWPMPGQPWNFSRIASQSCSSVRCERVARRIFSQAQWKSTRSLGCPTHSQMRTARRCCSRCASLSVSPAMPQRSSWGTVIGMSRGSFLSSMHMRRFLQVSTNLCGSICSGRKCLPKTAAFSRDSTVSGSCSYTAASMQVATASARSSLISLRDSCAQTSPLS